jgi:hypothetical protein
MCSHLNAKSSVTTPGCDILRLGLSRLADWLEREVSYQNPESRRRNISLAAFAGARGGGEGDLFGAPSAACDVLPSRCACAIALLSRS